MKTKQLFAILVALLMVSSIATASFFGDFANMMYKKAEPGINTAATSKESTSIIASGRQLCTANADCTSGTCTSCKCVANIEAATPSLSTPTKTPTVTAAPATKTVVAQTKTPTVTGIKSATTIKSLITMPTGKAVAISLPSSALTASKSVIALKANGLTCASAADCTSRYCKSISSTSSPAITKQCAACTANTQCETGKVCTSGRCIAQALKANGITCTANTECTSGYCKTTSAASSPTIIKQCAASTISAVAASPALTTTSASTPTVTAVAASPTLTAANGAEYTACLTECKAECRTECGATTSATGLTAGTGKAIALSSISNIKSATAVKTTATSTATTAKTTTASTATTSTAVKPAATPIDTCVSTCDAKCETDCRASSTPAKIANNEACNNPAHCENQCESGKYECSCEGNAIMAAGTEVQAQTRPETVEAAILSPELEMKKTPAKINLAPIEAKQASFERKALADEIVTAEEVESLKLNYNLLSEEKKLENLEARYNLIIDALLEDSTLTDAQKAELRESRIATQTATAAITPTPKVNVGFFRQLGNLFTGKVVFTGYAAAPSDDSKVVSAGSAASLASSTTTAPPSAADIARYKSILSTMDTDLLSIETRVCNKFKEAGFNLNRGPECTRDSNCGTTGLMTCQTGDSGRKYCKFNLNAVCPDPDSALKPSGASIFSECRSNKECASGLCQIRGATPSMPEQFCWCTANADCLAGYTCNTATGVCATATGGTSSTTTPPTLAPAVLKSPTFISKIGSIFTGGRA